MINPKNGKKCNKNETKKQLRNVWSSFMVFLFILHSVWKIIFEFLHQNFFINYLYENFKIRIWKLKLASLALF